ncbi:ATP-binding protein [Brevibacillus ginsengisoli]|uniref:ATP-binding protein n=1 Tax=Brevibacillus ginsengisoli TaxID=363854 RepID=UPI003CE70B03
MKKIRITLFTQIVLLITSVVVLSTIIVSVLFTAMLVNILENYMGQQAMIVAKLTSANDKIIDSFKQKNPSSTIQPITESYRLKTGASYIVVAGKEGIRYSHPNPSFIGKPTATKVDTVINSKQSALLKANGPMGEAIKAITPITNDKGEAIGATIVGFLRTDIERRVFEYKANIILLSVILLSIGAIGAFFIARRIKRLFFGLEPEEVSFLFKEKEAILEFIRDAIVAVDLEVRVISMNKRARELLENLHLTVGGKFQNERLKGIIHEVIQTKKGQSNQNILFGHELFMMDLSPILQEDKVMGVALTIRPHSEIEQLNNEISKINTYFENMRAHNHEYLNRLNTIYGLLGLKQYDKAMELISGEVKERQDIIAFLMSSVKEPLIAACLLGKSNRSKELKVSLEIDRESNLESIPEHIDSKLLVTILGNIIDNAMDAARANNPSGSEVKVSFTDLGNDIIFDVEDNGAGVPKDLESAIFSDGFTTKNGDNHGIGLALVKNSLELLNGQIFLSNSQLGGARFTVVIPKN